MDKLEIHDDYNTLIFDLTFIFSTPSQKTVELILQRFMLKKTKLYRDYLIWQTDTQHNNFNNILIF